MDSINDQLRHQYAEAKRTSRRRIRSADGRRTVTVLCDACECKLDELWAAADGTFSSNRRYQEDLPRLVALNPAMATPPVTGPLREATSAETGKRVERLVYECPRGHHIPARRSKLEAALRALLSSRNVSGAQLRVYLPRDLSKT